MAVPTNKESTRFSSLLVKGMRSDANTMAKVPLTLQEVTGQTANLAEFKNAAGTVLSRIDVDGNFNTVLTTISAAAITGTTAGLLGHAAGVVLVADPGAGLVLELVAAVMSFTYSTAQYGGGGNITVNINGGAALTGLVSAANSLGAASSNITMFVPLATAGIALTSNKGLNLVAASAFTQPGTAAGTVKVWTTYRLHTL